MEARSCNHCCSGKAINITYSDYVFVAPGIQHEMRMRNIFIFGIPRSAIFFSTLSHKRNDSLKKVIRNTMCFDFLYVLYLKHFSF